MKVKLEDISISLLEKGDIREAARVLSVAMLNNPLHVAIYQGTGETERKEIEKMFIELFADLPGICFLAKFKERIVGVMRMKSCNGDRDLKDPDEDLDPGDVAGRTAVWDSEWARHDPREQHWHLGPIGVLPDYHGNGIGTKLIQRFCSEVDACRAAAYLETDLEKNVRFYKKFGFKEIAESDILNTRSVYMWRPALK